MKTVSFTVRLAWLLALVTLGLGVGFVGYHFTADQRWFLAVPGAIAMGWLFLANPEQCLGGSCAAQPRTDDDDNTR